MIIGYLIYKQIVYPTVIPMVIKGGASLFADWTVILNANDCVQKGYDVFLENPCDKWNRKHVYGEILLHIPYIRSFAKFYYFYFPLILNFIFLYVISYSLFNLDYKKSFPFLLLLVFSLPVILVIERSNIDLIVFIFIFLISKYNSKFLSYFLIIISSISKIYPILLSVVFFFENKKKDILINLIIILIILSVLFGLQFESFVKIFNNKGQFSGFGYGLYEFSFLGLFKFINNLDINFNGSNFNWVKYLYILLFVILPVILLNILNNSKINLLFDNGNFNLDGKFENKIYFISSTIIVFCYFTFSNFIYREIFFLGLVPALLIYKNTSKSNILNFYFYFLITKFILTTIFIYFYQNNIFPMIKPLLIVFKHTIDFFLVSIVLRFYYNFLILFARKKLLQITY